MEFNPEQIHSQYEDFYTNRFITAFEKNVKEFIKEGYSSSIYYKERKEVEDDFRQLLNRVYLDETTLELINDFRDIDKGWQSSNYNKTFNSKSFKSKLDNSSLDYKLFLRSHAVYDALYNLLKLSGSNSTNIVELLIAIYDDEKLRQKVDIDTYNFSELLKDGKNSSEYKRLNSILNPKDKSTNDVNPSKSEVKIKRLEKELTIKDITVFLIFFSSYFKVKARNLSELSAIAYLFFDDFDTDLANNKPLSETTIYKYLTPNRLLTKKFDFEASKTKIIKMLSYNKNRRYSKLIEYIVRNDLTSFEQLMNEIRVFE
jgi:hypothetical protein